MMRLFLMALCVSTIGSGYVDKGINDYILGYDMVIDGGVIVYDNQALVGILTQPFYTRSQAEQYKQELEDALIEKFNFKSVIVSFDTDIIYQVKKAKDREISEQKLKELFNSARIRRNRQG